MNIEMGPNVALNIAFNNMTLRNWFAGQALAGLLANKITDRDNVHTAAAWAYSTADAMLAERERGK